MLLLFLAPAKNEKNTKGNLNSVIIRDSSIRKQIVNITVVLKLCCTLAT